MSARWEFVEVSDQSYGEAVERLPVPGGWLYRVYSYTGSVTVMSIAFVPDIDDEGGRE